MRVVVAMETDSSGQFESFTADVFTCDLNLCIVSPFKRMLQNVFYLLLFFSLFFRFSFFKKKIVV